MQRLALTLATISAAVVLVAGSAGATVWWESQYDLTGSTSTVTIYDPLTFPWPVGPPFIGPFPPNTITGTMTVRWGAASASAPITQGRLIGGTTHANQYMHAGIFIITGMANAVFLLPVPQGEPGGVSGNVFTFGVVADSSTTGYIHCTAGSCALGGFTLSVPKPLTPTGPGPFPLDLSDWTFAGTGVGGVGDSWTSPPFDRVIPPNPPATPYTNVITTTYVGQEISRVPEPGSLVMLLPGAVLLGTLGWLRRRR
jgi:hypothetical protein